MKGQVSAKKASFLLKYDTNPIAVNRLREKLHPIDSRIDPKLKTKIFNLIQKSAILGQSEKDRVVDKVYNMIIAAEDQKTNTQFNCYKLGVAQKYILTKLWEDRAEVRVDTTRLEGSAMSLMRRGLIYSVNGDDTLFKMVKGAKECIAEEAKQHFGCNRVLNYNVEFYENYYTNGIAVL